MGRGAVPAWLKTGLSRPGKDGSRRGNGNSGYGMGTSNACLQQYDSHGFMDDNHFLLSVECSCLALPSPFAPPAPPPSPTVCSQCTYDPQPPPGRPRLCAHSVPVHPCRDPAPRCRVRSLQESRLPRPARGAGWACQI
jgi:hypothetical protein